MTHPLVMDNNCVNYPDPTKQWGVMAWTRILGMCALWPWPWRYELGRRSWHTLGSWTTIVWIIQIQHGSEELWPGHRFWVCVDCDLDDMTLGQGQDTPFGHEQCDTMWTDGQTDRRTDRVIPIYPQTLFAGGITKCILVTMVYYKCTTSKLSLALLKSYKEIQMQFLVWIMYGKHVYVLINDSWILFLKTRLHNLIWKFCI